ncbi:MAG TPA: DinB family protein [Bryobacteraceae bacterium]|nr:DinB family protein [Bryobacteraceae bacterium]
MSQVPAWFERKFSFTFPLELYPNLLVRLWGTPTRLEELIGHLAPAVLTTESGDKWSAQEEAGHLLDMEPLWLTRVEDFFSERDTLTVADLTNRKTHEANHNARAVGEILQGFRDERLKLLTRVDNLGADSAARTVLHPRLRQPMRLIDHLYFVAEHDDHHLARIREMIQR